MVRFTARRLEAHELAAAFALARCAVPEVTPERWKAFAASLAPLGGGMLVVEAEGALIGLAAYRPDVSLAHGRLLRIDLLAAFELHRSAPVRAALLEGLDRIARESDCESVGLALSGHGATLPAPARVESWESLGHHIGSLFMVRKLAPETVVEKTRVACAA